MDPVLRVLLPGPYPTVVEDVEDHIAQPQVVRHPQTLPAVGTEWEVRTSVSESTPVGRRVGGVVVLVYVTVRHRGPDIRGQRGLDPTVNTFVGV